MQLWNVLKKNRGFTLVEMLAVTVIVGVIAAVATPNLLGMLNNARVTDGMRDIEGAFEEAKRQATRLSQRCVIQVTTVTIDGETRATVRPAPAGAGIPANNNRCLLENRILPSDVTIAIAASPSGTPPNTLEISSKGSFHYGSAGGVDFTDRTFTVSHPNAGSEKCVYIEDLFGDVQTGIILGGTCDTSL